MTPHPPAESRAFSDRGAPARIVAALLLTMALGGYYAWWALQPESGWRWAMQAPAERNGATMIFPLWTVTAIVGPDRYEISKVVQGVPIVGPAQDLAVGDTVSVLGHFDASVSTPGQGSAPAVRADVREHHVLRKYKEALGIFGFLFVVVAAPFAFRIERRRLVERG
ncbi:MAG: hypothetical protein Q8P18_27100 [Pseudomonadota bacterium]|nr:hypothetical protein [Pseudomonadota bacterium]